MQTSPLGGTAAPNARKGIGLEPRRSQPRWRRIDRQHRLGMYSPDCRGLIRTRFRMLSANRPRLTAPAKVKLRNKGNFRSYQRRALRCHVSIHVVHPLQNARRGRGAVGKASRAGRRESMRASRLRRRHRRDRNTKTALKGITGETIRLLCAELKLRPRLDLLRCFDDPSRASGPRLISPHPALSPLRGRRRDPARDSAQGHAG